MSTQRFVAGARFRWQNITYEIKRLLPEGRANIEDIFTGEVRTELISTLISALFDGTLRFAVVTRNGKEGNLKEEFDNPVLALDDYPEHLVSIARARLAVIQPLIESAGKRTSADVERRVNEVRTERDKNCEGTLLGSLSVASIYRWIGDYARSGNDLRSLIPNTRARGGKGLARISPDVDALVNTVLHDKSMVRETVTIDDVVREVAVRIQEINVDRPQHEQLILPSRSTIVRRIDALDIGDRFAAKHGKRAAKRQLKQYGKTEKPTAPLERVEIDHTRTDLIVIDDQDNLPLGRLTLTYCLDIATRYLLGYYLGFEPPSYLAVMECLYHAIRPKENVRERYGTEHDWIAYGVPSTLVIDNAKEFIGKDLKDACLLLGIVLQQTPVQTPYFKPGVERMIGTMNTMLFHTIPGTTFSNPQQRGDYDSVQQACVYLSDIDKIMHLFTLDIYAEKYHRGLKGIPARRWEAATRFGFAPRLPPNAEELRILLGRVDYRAIHHYGIEFESLPYNCDELLPLRTRLQGTRVKIKYHPGDLSRLYIFDPFDSRYIEVPSLWPEYTQGLSLWKHRIICDTARAEGRTVDQAALGRARRKIQAIVEAGRDRKRTSTRASIARWDTAGKATRDLDDRSRDGAAQVGRTPTPVDIPTPLLPGLLSDDLLRSGSNEQTEDDGWELDFSLPKSHSHTSQTDGDDHERAE